MPQGAGTSVVGWQKIVAETERELTIFALSIDGDLENPPDDVGYFYVCLFVNNNDPQMTFAHGIVYRQGVVLELPDSNASSLHQLTAWVRWKVPNLNYAVFV